MSGDDKLRLASIGLGWWGGELAAAAERSGAAEIVSCFARTPDTRRAFAEAHDCRAAGSLDELMADPDIEAVLVATSHQSHRQLVEAAAAAGKHVFVEKPLTTTYDDGKACVEAAERAGILLQVGHQRRRTAANMKIKEMIARGELGDIETVVAHQSIPNGFRMPDEAWRWDPDQSPLGSMTSLGIHKIDTMHFLVGPITRVSALTRPGRSKPIDEATVLAVEFDSGAVGTLTTSFFTPVVNEIAFFGTEGAALNLAAGTRLQFQATGEPEPREIELVPADPVADQIAAFATSIRRGEPADPDGRAGLRAIAVLDAAVESAATGRAVDVRDD